MGSGSSAHTLLYLGSARAQNLGFIGAQAYLLIAHHTAHHLDGIFVYIDVIDDMHELYDFIR